MNLPIKVFGHINYKRNLSYEKKNFVRLINYIPEFLFWFLMQRKDFILSNSTAFLGPIFYRVVMNFGGDTSIC